MDRRIGKLQARVHQIILSVVFCAAFLVAFGAASEKVNATAATTPTVKDIVVVNSPSVNVRALPSTNSTSLGKVAQNTYLARYEMRADGWSYIDYAGTPAYVMTQFLTPYGGTAAAQVAVPNQVTPATGFTATTPALPTTPAITSAPATSGGMVWIPNSGKKYHSRPNCSKMKNPTQVTLQQAVSMGYEPCKVCH